MPLPTGVEPVLGPFLDTSGALLLATPELRDAGAVSLRGGRIQKVNAAGDDWEDLLGGVVLSLAHTASTVTVQYFDTNDALRTLVFNRFTDANRHDLNSIPGLVAKTSDLAVVKATRSWGDLTDVDLGAFASDSDGNLGPSDAAALSYQVSLTGTLQTATNHFVYLRIPLNRDVRDYRLRQDGSLGEFFITSWDHVGIHDSLNYYRSRHNLFEGYQITVQYDAVTAIQTHYRGQTEWDNIQGKDAARPSTPQIAAGTDPAARPWAVPDVVETIVEHERFTDEDDRLLDGLAGRHPSHPDDRLHRLHTIRGDDLFGQYREIAGVAYYDEDLYGISEDGYANDTQIHSGAEIDGGATRNADFWFVAVGDDILSIPVAGGVNLTYDWNTNNNAAHRSMSLTVDVSDNDSKLYQMIWNGGETLRIHVYDIAANGALTLEDSIAVTRDQVNAALPSEYLDLSILAQMTPDGLSGFGTRAISVVGDTMYLYIGGVRRMTSFQVERVAVMPWTIAGNAGARTLTVDVDGIFDLPFSLGLTAVVQLDDVTATLFLADRYDIDEYTENTEGIPFPIEDEGEIVVRRPTGLDFTGRVTVTEDAEGAANVDITAGSGELHPVDSIYTLDEENTTDVDTLADRRAGDIFFCGTRDCRIFTVTVPIRPDNPTDRYQMLVQPVTEQSDTSYMAIAGARIEPASGLNGDLYTFDFPNGVPILADSFFAIMVENLEGRPAQAFSSMGLEESFEPVHAFEFIAKASNDEAVFAAGSETFHRDDFSVRMEIEYTVEVEDLFDVRKDGLHVISAPHFIDFRGNLATVEEFEGGVRIEVLSPSLPQVAGSARVGEHTEIILWQYVFLGAAPGPPPDPWNDTDQTFLANLGLWYADRAAALAARANASDALWIAYGGTDNAPGGEIANRPWSIQAVQAEQSSTDRGLTWHVFDDNDPTYRFLRADGTWSPPLHRADDPFGWINLVTDVETYSTSGISYRFQSLVADFDATNFAEMEILIKAFGSYDALGQPTSYGIEDSIVIRRQGDEWATFHMATDYETQSRGTWKLRLDDREGISAAKYSGPLTDDGQDSNIHDTPDFPERRMSFNMNIFAEEFDPHALAGFSFHHFPSIYAKCLTSVRIR